MLTGKGDSMAKGDLAVSVSFSGKIIKMSTIFPSIGVDSDRIITCWDFLVLSDWSDLDVCRNAVTWKIEKSHSRVQMIL